MNATMSPVDWLPSRRGLLRLPIIDQEEDRFDGAKALGEALGAFAKKRGLFGQSRPVSTNPALGDDSVTNVRLPGGSQGIVATPEQIATTRALEREYGVPANAATSPGDTLAGGIGLNGTMGAPRQSTSITDLIGPEPEKPRGFWQGGKKFTGKDALAAALSVLADGIALNQGYKDGASSVSALTKMRSSGSDDYEEKLKTWQGNKLIAGLPNMSPRELAAYRADPKGWGGHMSDALSSHYTAANVSPGEERVYGAPHLGGTVYQAPTSAEQYARSFGFQPGTADYDTALQDYTLKSSGPTAYGFDTRLDDHRTNNDIRYEGVRQKNRLGMEGYRQQGRVDLRSQPTYRDLNPRSRGGRENIPTMKTPAEAEALPPGTKYKTPDGRVRIR